MCTFGIIMQLKISKKYKMNSWHNKIIKSRFIIEENKKIYKNVEIFYVYIK